MQLFEKLKLRAYDLTVDILDMHAVSSLIKVAINAHALFVPSTHSGDECTCIYIYIQNSIALCLTCDLVGICAYTMYMYMYVMYTYMYNVYIYTVHLHYHTCST